MPSLKVHSRTISVIAMVVFIMISPQPTIIASPPSDQPWEIRKLGLQTKIANLFERKDYLGASSTLLLAISEAQKAKDKIFEAKCLNNKGIAACKLGDNALGIESFQESIRIYASIGNDTLVAQSQLNLGILYKDFASYEKAVILITNAAVIFERLNLSRELASALNTLGNIMRERGDYIRALSYLRKSLFIRKEIGNTKGIGESLNNIGITLLAYGQTDSAILLLKQSIAYKLRNADFNSLAPTYSSLGESYLQKADLDSAMFAFQQSLTIRRGGQECKGIITSQLKLAKIHLLLKNYESSRLLLDSVDIGLRNYYARDLLLESKLISSKLFATIGRYDLAYQDQLTYSLLKDSLLNREKEKIMTNAEIQFEVAQKEAENKQLTLKSTIHKQKELMLLLGLLGVSGLFIISFLVIINVNKKKKIIEKLIETERHNTYNYLIKITQLVSQQSQEVREEISKSQWQAFETRIRAMQLLSSTLGKDNEASDIELTHYIITIWDNLAVLFGFKGDVLSLDAIEIHEDVDTAHTIGLIANELICNALKYALFNHPNPNIKITLSKDSKNRNRLSIEDNGLEENHFQPKSTGGQGLRLVKEWTKWIKGELILTSNSPGTTITIIWESKKRSGIWKSRSRRL